MIRVISAIESGDAGLAEIDTAVQVRWQYFGAQMRMAGQESECDHHVGLAATIAWFSSKTA